MSAELVLITDSFVDRFTRLVDDTLQHYECDECAGTGAAVYGPSWRDDLEPETCHKCRGKGWIG